MQFDLSECNWVNTGLRNVQEPKSESFKMEVLYMTSHKKNRGCGEGKGRGGRGRYVGGHQTNISLWLA